MRLGARSAGALLLLLSVGLSACRNPESGTTRGPTREPGDTVPIFFIHHEQGTAMRELGDPVRPSGEPLSFPALDTATQGAQQAPAAAPAAKPAAAVPLPAGVTQAMVDEGKKTFDTVCFACHGQGAAGGPLAPQLVGRTSARQWLNIDGSYESIVKLVTAGVPQPKQHPAPMPPKGGAPLTDEQVRAVSAWVYSISR